MRFTIDRAAAEERERRLLESQGRSIAKGKFCRNMKNQVSQAVKGKWSEERFLIRLGEIAYQHDRILNDPSYYTRLEDAAAIASEASESVHTLVKIVERMEWFQYHQMSLLHDRALEIVDADINSHLFERSKHKNIPAAQLIDEAELDVTSNFMLLRLQRTSFDLSILSELLKHVTSLPHRSGKAKRLFLATMELMDLWSELTKEPVRHPRSYLTKDRDRSGKRIRNTTQRVLLFVWNGLRLIEPDATLANAETSMKNVFKYRKSVAAQDAI
jgi:hypothetical protein